MGIFINGSILPGRIDAERWAGVYDDSLKILSYGQLAECVDRDYLGQAYLSLVPSVDTNGKWHVTGDMITGSNMESHTLHRDLSYYQRENRSEAGDVLLADIWDADKYGLSVPDAASYFSSKTQGERGHLYLLAVACLITDAFPEAASVSGDITAAQCQRACEIVQAATGRNIRIPVQFDYVRLYDRLVKLEPDESRLLRLFFDLYHGAKGKTYRQFLQDHFSIDAFRDWFLEEHRDSGLEPIVREWLELDLPLQELCGFVVHGESGWQFSVQDLIGTLVTGHVHIRDKNTYDVTKTDPDNERPDNVPMLFTRAFAMLAGMRNRNIDRYIPEDELKKTLRDAFPDENTDELFDAAVKADTTEPDANDKKGAHRKIVDGIYQFVEEKARELQAKPEQYDLDRWQDAFFWKPGQSVVPALLENMRKTAAQVLEFGKSNMEEFRPLDVYSRVCYLMQRTYRRMAFPETVWQNIIRRVMEDEYIVRYVGLVNVDTDSKNGSEIVNYFSMNPELFAFLLQ